MMPLRLTSPTVGLIPTSADTRRGADDRAVGLGADGHGAQARRGGRARAAARSAGVAIERIRVARQPATPAPAAGGVLGAEVRPLAQVRLAEQHGAGLAQARDDAGVAQRDARRRRASEPAVVFMRSAVSMLSLISTGMPCSGPRTRARLAFGVEPIGDVERVGVQLDDAVEASALTIDGVDATQVGLRQRARRQLARLQRAAQVVDAALHDLVADRRAWRWRRAVAPGRAATGRARVHAWRGWRPPSRSAAGNAGDPWRDPTANARQSRIAADGW